MRQHYFLRTAFCVTITGILLLFHHQVNGAPEDLASRHGYAILHLDPGGVAPAITVKRINSSRPWKRTFSFDGSTESRLEILAMPEGRYQIIQVNAPHFDLPYRLNTKEDPGWRFSVTREKANYIGALIIGKERRIKSVDIRFLNRVAMDIPLIQEAFPEILDLYPLTMGWGQRDDFLLELEAARRESEAI